MEASSVTETSRRKSMMLSSTHGHGYDQLHSVRKSALHKPLRKQSLTQLPPNPTRVYKVKPIEFKDVVQKLTGANEFQSTRLHTIAPAPLDLNLGGVVRVLPDETQGKMIEQLSAAEVKSNAMGFALSPSSSAWCSFLLLSPPAGSTMLL